MAAKLFMTSYSSSGALATLDQGDSAYIADGINVGSTDAKGLLAYFSGHVIDVFGNLISWDVSIDLQGDPDTKNNKINIYESSRVWSYGSVSIVMHSANSTIDNDGYIKGQQGIGVGSAAAALSTSTVLNSGIIEATSSGVGAIYRYLQSVDTINLVNSGTIKGPGLAYTSQGNGGKDNITNSGVIVGGIKLDGGDDLYDGRTGSVKGIVYGGEGADRLYGGKEANELHGDAGKDRIYGGGAADKLYGGADSDAFIYNAITESNNSARDTIYDFNHADVIELKTIDAKSGTATNDAFTFIGTAAYTKHAGELRYLNTGGNTYVGGDTNGDGVTDFAVKLAGTFTMEKGDFLL